MVKDYCFGCLIGCDRAFYHAEDGKKGKFMCQAASLYDRLALNYYGKLTEVPFYATKLCDDYGICTKAVAPILNLLNECYKNGLLTEKDTHLPLSQIGSQEFIGTLLHDIAFKEGFGVFMSQGAIKFAEALGPAAKKMLTVHRSADTSEYGPRLYLHTAMLRATEPARAPIGQLHEIGLLFHRWLPWLRKEDGAKFSTDILLRIIKRFWGDEEAADFSTYSGKALAAKKIQDRHYARECLILCDSLWPVYALHNLGLQPAEPLLECKSVSAITGKKIDEEEFYFLGERIFNLQRAILLREGYKGRGDDVIMEADFTIPLKGEIHNPECLVPGSGGEVISRKGQVVDKEKFEKMKDEYYGLRGWDVKTGIPARGTMETLGLQQIAKELSAA